MGRPLNKKYFGDPNLTTRTFPALTMSSAWMLGQTAISTSPVYIVKQTGASSYLVTDGTNSGIVSLGSATPAAAGQGTILVTPYVAGSEGGATFTFSYLVGAATVTAGHAGTGYAVNDTITLANGIILTVATINTGAVATVTVTNGGSVGAVTSAATSAVAQVSSSGAGTGAQFDLTYKMNTSATVSGGTGYTANENIAFAGFTATTAPVAKISAVTGNGVPSGVTVTNQGAGITVSGTAAGSNPAATEYARSIKSRTVRTWADNIYSWAPFGSPTIAGQASLPLSGTGSESSTYNEDTENALTAGGTPYILPNQGVSAKAAQIVATAGLPGGAGGQSQTAAIAGQTTGYTNPSATQRKAPTESRTERMARLAKERQDASNLETEERVKREKEDESRISKKNGKKKVEENVEQKNEEENKPSLDGNVEFS